MIPLVGLLLGIVAGAMSVGSLWLIVRMTGRAARSIADIGSGIAEVEKRPSGWDVAPTNTRWDVEKAPPPPYRPVEVRQGAEDGIRGDEKGRTLCATLRLLFAFLLKAPLLILIARGTQTLGIVGARWCVGGVVLVYCFAVFWAAGRTHRL